MDQDMFPHTRFLDIVITLSIVSEHQGHTTKQTSKMAKTSTLLTSLVVGAALALVAVLSRPVSTKVKEETHQRETNHLNPNDCAPFVGL
jgi:hypothetical protein